MRLPSLDQLARAASRTALRFPATMLAAVIACAAAIAEIDDLGPESLGLRLLAAASLGLPLCTAATLWAEHGSPRSTRHAAATLGAVAVLVGFFLVWPAWSDVVRASRYAQLSVAFHLLVAFLPLAGRRSEGAFWEYNRLLFTRFLTSALFSATLFLGLALALAAVDALFGVDVDGQAYGRLWLVIAFVFNTWFFLGGVPRPEELDRPREYPTPLRVFAQYTLVPLVSLYLLILIVYLGKVVVTWDWPSGWIGWLVSGVATAGILALLLVHPVAHDPAHRWVGVFARGFWVAVLPAVGMLWLALYQRVDQYGVTINRYWIIAASAWLAGIALYYAITRSRTIRWIPASLCVVALATFAGPWGAYATARRSQAERLTALLRNNGLLDTDGALVTPAQPVAREASREISAATRYLVEVYGPGAVAPLAGAGSAEMPRGRVGARNIDSVAGHLVRSMGVEYRPRGERSGRGEMYGATAAGGPEPITGYDWRVPILVTTPADSGLAATWRRQHNMIGVHRDGALLIDVPLDSILARLVLALPGRRGALPDTLFRGRAEAEGIEAEVRLSSISWQETDSVPAVTAVEGHVLVRMRP